MRYPKASVRPTPADRLRLGDADAEGENDTEGAGTDTETGSGECVQGAEEACRWGGFLDEVERFDAGFLGVSPPEADLIDSQQRLVLELAQEALEDSRIVPDAHGGTRTGVFTGAAHDDYATLLHRLADERVTHRTFTGAHDSTLNCMAMRARWPPRPHRQPPLLTCSACTAPASPLNPRSPRQQRLRR
ncbi:beta-ketoacyl synthase N-terminal-like domain-containing protein [Streptomyces lasiicapitis]|uniref:beta-ketoacyl synthase N-terminal-like domain-containing protein n=1 Tax=Streptomyces lasiicapitis TaxID=1923961 RepID=UPI003659307D